MENNIKKNKRFYLIVALLLAAMAILQYLIYSFNDVLSYFYMGNTIYYMRFLVFPFAIWAIYRFVKYKKIDSVLSILVMFGFCFSLDRYYNYIRRFDGDASQLNLLKKNMFLYFLIFLSISIVLHYILVLRKKKTK